MKRTPQGAPSNVVVRSIAFTPATLAALEALAAEISPRTERKTSVSAVVRALLRYSREIPQIAAKLEELIDKEQSSEVIWGKPTRRP
jgi:hypothetical protein